MWIEYAVLLLAAVLVGIALWYGKNEGGGGG